ncbi:MAG: phosphatidylglycerophosphatase A [candidate division WOR-3 bacterium]
MDRQNKPQEPKTGMGFLLWIYLGILVILSFVPSPVAEGGPYWTDKAFHFAGYFFLVYFFLIATGGKGRPFAWVLAAAIAFLTESVQDLMPWRQASLLDAFWGIAGASVAVFLPQRTNLWLLRNFSTMFFVGYMPKAPATWASGFVLLALFFAPLSPPIIFMLLLPLAVMAFWSAHHAESLWGPDPKRVVIDEALGAGLSVMFLPKTSIVYILAFLLFRAFDILKPPPVRQLDRMEIPGAIVLDDVAAGLMTNLVLWALVLFTSLEEIGLRQVMEFILAR